MMMKWWWNDDGISTRQSSTWTGWSPVPGDHGNMPVCLPGKPHRRPWTSNGKTLLRSWVERPKVYQSPTGKKNYWCWKWGSTCIIMHIGFIGFFMDLLTAHYRCCCQLSIKGSIFNFWFPSGFAALSWTCVSWRCLTPPAGSAVISFFIRMENHSCLPTLEQGIDPVQRFTARVLLSGCVSEWMTGIIN